MLLKKLKRRYGYGIAAIIITAPVLIWLASAGFTVFTQSFPLFLRSLGKTAALSGLAAYALMPILSMRHQVLEILFGGMTTLYKIHRQLGKISFYLIALHPLLFGIGTLIEAKSITRMWDWSSLLILSGIAGIFAFTLIIAVILYAHITHQRWILVHRLFGWLLPLFFVHALVARSQILKIDALFYYMLTLGILGFLAFLYRSVLGVWLVKKYTYTVSEVNKFSEGLTEFVLKPTALPITYAAGQYAYISFLAESIDKEAHPFSFTTAPNGPYLRFVIKSLGDETSKYHKIPEGTKVLLEGPYGSFSYMQSKNPHQVWIAGGVGVTPFLSLARSLSKHSPYKVHFLYAVDKLEDAVFLPEFLDVHRALPEIFSVTVINKTTSGFVSTDLLKRELEDINRYDYLICGPPPMLHAIRIGLHKEGVSDEQIYYEEFALK